MYKIARMLAMNDAYVIDDWHVMIGLTVTGTLVKEPHFAAVTLPTGQGKTYLMILLGMYYLCRGTVSHVVFFVTDEDLKNQISRFVKNSMG